jgi:hypothetical protein
MPLTISINSPNVSNMAGSENITRIGLTTVLMIENIKPASKNPNIPAVISTF